MDVVSHGSDAGSAGRDNTPLNRDLLWRSGLLGGGEVHGSRRLHDRHLPGLVNHRWWRGLLLLLLLLLSLVGHSERVALRCIPLVLRSAGLRKWVNNRHIGNESGLLILDIPIFLRF